MSSIVDLLKAKQEQEVGGDMVQTRGLIYKRCVLTKWALKSGARDFLRKGCDL